MNYTILSIGIFIIVSLVNSYLDFRTFHISLILNYAGIILCILVYAIYNSFDLIKCGAGGGLLFLIFIMVRQIAHKGLGWGDIHYSFFCGFIAGFPGFILCAICSSLMGILYFVFLKIVLRKKNIRKIRIPFVPMMFIGTLISIPISSFVVPLL